MPEQLKKPFLDRTMNFAGMLSWGCLGFVLGLIPAAIVTSFQADSDDVYAFFITLIVFTLAFALKGATRPASTTRERLSNVIRPFTTSKHPAARLAQNIAQVPVILLSILTAGFRYKLMWSLPEIITFREVLRALFLAPLIFWLIFVFGGIETSTLFFFVSVLTAILGVFLLYSKKVIISVALIAAVVGFYFLLNK